MDSKRLESWKEIAAYLGRSVRTVQRWEKENRLPVHRVPGEGLERVCALADELEHWMHSDRPPDAGPPFPAENGGGVTFRLDRQLRLLGVDTDPAYLAYHRCLEANGMLDHPFSKEELDGMEPILYWNGERYAAEPTRNLRRPPPSGP